MKRIIEIMVMALSATVLCSCGEEIEVTGTLDEAPIIFPDYSGVTVPCNIAPLNFRLDDGNDWEGTAARLTCGDIKTTVEGEQFDIPMEKWKALTAKAGDISVQVLVKKDGKWLGMNSFQIHVSADSIDSHLAYRLIDPGYESWNRMGLYERNLENFDEKAIVTNEDTDRNCMNCHSFCSRDPGRMVFHMRGANGGTYLLKDGDLQKLNTKTAKTISALVYPQWHPSGKYIAFSVNDIFQVFHSTNRNRVEVYDSASDIVLYDIDNQDVVTLPALMDTTVLETYPTFSPDGKTLFFCTSPQQKVPQDYKGIRYSICSVGFDPDSRTLSDHIDTLYSANSSGKCAVFPRVSPDGRKLMYTETAYGCFPIWHKDADLRIIDLQTREDKALDVANSDDVESYHSWSSNSRWFVFSSRRIDGLYTRPFIAHIDPDGNVTKPFVLPQKDTYHYAKLMKSFNVPEFITGDVPMAEAEFVRKAKEDKGIDIGCR